MSCIQRRGVVARRRPGCWASAQRHAALAAFTFVGVSCCFSRAQRRPRPDGCLGRVLPLGVIEASHFLASVAGAALLVVSQGLARRLDGAYYLTASLSSVGIAASLVKGLDYEEAALLCRRAGAARAGPSRVRSARRILRDAVFGRLDRERGARPCRVAWLGFFAFKHVEYSTICGGSSSCAATLRASCGPRSAPACCCSSWRCTPHRLRAARGAAARRSGSRGAARIIAGQRATSPYLALGGDKSLLFDEERRGFVMYGVQGRTWVALGDPVGPEDRMATLIRLFLDRCNDFGGLPVFYQVTPSGLHHYADLGMTLVKIGEEAKVDLQP